MLPRVRSQAGEAELPYIKMECEEAVAYMMQSKLSEDIKASCGIGHCEAAVAELQKQTGISITNGPAITPAPAICDQHPQGKFHVMLGFTPRPNSYVWTCTDRCVVIEGDTVTTHFLAQNGQPASTPVSADETAPRDKGNSAEGNKGGPLIVGVALTTCAVSLALQLAGSG
jgi:hypothetical protein